MRISCIQTNPQENVEENINTAFDLIKKAADQGTELAILPEMFTYMGDEGRRINTCSKLNEDVFFRLSKLAKELQIHLIAGSHSEQIKNNNKKVFNTSVTYNPNGEMICVYRKLHLFNLYDEDGKPLFCESESYEAGKIPEGYNITTTSQEKWNALNIICYDLRFPEIIRSTNKKTNHYDVIFVPAAFVWQTGKNHWETLLRARAIENQCYVVACNQTGTFFNKEKRNYGHSMIIDPWGNVIDKMGEEIGILSAEILKSEILTSRSRLPALHDRVIY